MDAPERSVHLDRLVDAAALHRLAEGAGLRITAPAARLPGIAAEVAAALVDYAAERGAPPALRPKLGETAAQARRLAKAAKATLALLESGDGGLCATLGLLNADPARSTPGVLPAIVLNSGEARGDMARDALFAEAGLRLNAPSPFGAYDVARVAAAALRQVAVLADAAAKRNAMVRSIGNSDPAAADLFAALRSAYEILHDGWNFTVTNTSDANGGRTTVPAGPAMVWTQRLFRHVADRAAGTPYAAALGQLAKRYGEQSDGLAKRIKQTRKPSARRHVYRLATSRVKGA